jgi:dTDP-4-amino-4,6-dideoxygalactose transaminase
MAIAGAARARTRLERLIEGEYHPRASLFTDSGTSALTLALIAADEGQGTTRGVVALPAYGCFDLGTAAVGAGVRVVFYDVSPRTLGPDWPSLERALAAGARSVVLAHWYGLPVDADRVMALASKTGAVVVDDAAQGVGAAIHGRPVGSFGDLGVLSFGRGKGRTGGGGGALLANTDRGAALLDRVRSQLRPSGAGLRQGAALAAQWVFGRPALFWIPASIPALRLGETPWHDPTPPRAMPGFAAGAVVAAWSDSAGEVAHRRGAAAAWRARYPGWTWPESDAADVVRGELRLPVLAASPSERDQLIREFSGAMLGYPAALPDLPQLAGSIELPAETPGARALAERLWTLPCHRFVD